MNNQITIYTNGQVSRGGEFVGNINLQEKTGKRLMKHEGRIYDLTHVFHTDKLGAKLEEVFG